MEDLRRKANNSWKAYWALAFISFIVVITEVNTQQNLITLSVKPENVTAVLGQPLVLNCIFSEPVRCNWQRDGDPLFIDDDDPTYTYKASRPAGEKSQDCTLKISALTESDFAKWRCSTFATSQRPATSSDEIWISKQVSPSEPVILFKDKKVSEIKLPTTDSTKDFICISQKGNPAPKLSWEVSGSPYLGSLQTTVEGPNLYSVKLAWDRLGEWQLFNNSKEIVCKASHPGFPTDKTATVVFKRNYAPKYVKVLAEDYEESNVRIGNEDRTNLTCVSDGQPAPTFQWEMWSEKDDLWKVLKDHNDQNITISFDLLGKYRCKASNDLNKYSPTISVNELIVSEKKAEMTTTGVIIGIVVGCALFLLIIVLVIIYMKRKQKAATPDKDGHAGGQDGRDPEAVDETTEKTALSEPQYDNVQQNGQDEKLNGKNDTSPVKVDENVNKKSDEVVYAQLDLTQKDTAKVRTPSETEKTEYAEIRFNQENHQNSVPA